MITAGPGYYPSLNPYLQIQKRSQEPPPPPPPQSSIVTATDANFQEVVLNSPLPTIVDFYAPWCPSCQQYAPTVEAVAEKYDGDLRVAKLNTDENKQTAKQYNVKNIPTTLFFKGGKLVKRLVGNIDQAKLEGYIDAFLNSGG
ncbi:MAG: thioredoxin [Armatimonadetes bacterium]|nr:thioredoxin [Armatimonadota bacterium]